MKAHGDGGTSVITREGWPDIGDGGGGCIEPVTGGVIREGRGGNAVGDGGTQF